MKLIWELTKASLKSRYRNTWGGFLWVHLNPIFTYTTHCFIFSKILNLNMPNIPLFLLGGVLPWSFFALSVEMASTSLVNARDLIKSFSVSPLIIATVLVIENFLSFLISFTLLCIVLFFYQRYPLNGFLYLPFALAIFFVFTLFTSITLSVLNVFFRDVRFLTSYSLNILFFLTPILYPENRIPEDLKWIIKINPIYKVIIPLRSCIYEYNSPLNLMNSLWAIAAIIFSFFIMIFVWKNFKNELIQKL